ncbi:hypothetical protein CANCADRAFT_124628 [Tortispora caseinolytica NRRL Y-17796]|uniref:HIT domain-containing protein n=1 Tax=Tortispora caseinolytica NRRL Y-17796 TaxID=767744 RepID=A0A1E4TA88_9ASCO|nr:hypothetical protein CANCADRAFT_124628 [Tortispora caseinolytica NRRL Y-17796]
MSASCIFCKIVKGEIPSFKLYESAKTFAFLDIGPTSKGHALVIPKYHGAKLHNIPDEDLVELLPVAKKIAKALEVDTDGPDGIGYNILQNNGRIAHQMVDHLHVHVIPKRVEKEGLIVGWPTYETSTDELKSLQEKILAKMDQ